MPNSIKYSITPETQVLRSGNFYIGVGNIETGPTYWTGISPPVSGYTVYVNKESQGPSIFAPTNDNSLITITNQIGGTIKNFAYELTSWVVKNSVITEISDGSVEPPNSGAKVWQCVVNTSLYANTLHRIWSSGSGNGIAGSLGNGYYRYYLWVRGKSTNADTAWISIDISDGKSSGNITIGKSESWQLIQVWDNTSGNYNVNKFFDIAFNNTNGDTFYISSIVIAAFNTNATESLGQLTYYPGYINYLSTIPVSFPLKEDCFVYSNTRADLLIVNKDYPTIATSGLVLNLDASFRPSYTGSGTTWYDVSVSGYTATLNNNPYFNNSGWINFDGTDDYGAVGSRNGVSFTDTDDMTVMINLKINNKNVAGVLGRFSASAISDGWCIWVYLNKIIFFNTNSSGQYDPAYENTGYSFIDGTWFNFAVTRDSTNKLIKLYVNGSLNQQYSTSSSSYKKTNNGISIASLGASYYMNGDISNVGIYNRALSQDEIYQSFYGGNIVTNGLVLYLDSGNLVSYPQSGTTWYNISGSGNTATLVNGPTFNSSYGGSIVFDGVNDYVTLGVKNLVSTDYSINIWFRCSTNTTKEHFLVSLGYNNNNSVLFMSNTNLGGNLVLMCYYNVNGSVTGREISQVVLSNTAIVNLSFTRSSGVNVSYINGVIQNTKTFSESVTLGSYAYDLGYATQRNKTTAYMQGDIFMFSINNRALTASEIQQNYNATKSRFGL